MMNYTEILANKYNLPIFPETVKKYIGEGGFGIVYSSEYKGVKFAIKDIKDVSKINEVEKEIVNVIGMRHSNIPRIYGLTKSKIEGGLAIVFELIEGKNFHDYIKKQIIPKIEKIGYFIDMTETVEYIHKNDIIHRDLKPENMMIKSSNASFKLLDFGISRKTYNEETKTLIVGTPKYMAPENYVVYFGTGESKNVNSRTTISNKIDIWALGIIMSEIYTNEPPWSKYTKDDPKTLMMKNINFPVPDSIDDITIRELILDCTINSPHKRCNILYIKKKLMQSLFRAIKFNPDVLMRGEFDFTDKQYYCFLKKVYSHLKFYKDILLKDKLVADKIKFSVKLTFMVQPMNTHIKTILYTKEFNKDMFLTSGSDKTIKLWNLKSKKREKVREFSGLSSEVTIMIAIPEFKPDKSYFVAGCVDGKIEIFSLKEESDKPIIECRGHSGEITCLLYPREYNKETLISGSKDTSIRIWKLSNVKEKKLETMVILQNGHLGSINCLYYLSNFNFGLSKNFFISTSEDKSMKSWNISKLNNHLDKQFVENKDTITCILESVEFTEDNSAIKGKESNVNMVHFITGSKEGNVTLWNYSKMKVISQIYRHNGQVNHLISLKKYEPDWFASCGNDNIINIYDIHKPSKLIKSLIGHINHVVKMCYLSSVNEEVIASLSLDGSIKIWNFITEAVIYNIEYTINQKFPYDIKFLEGNAVPTIVSYNGRNVFVWQIKN